MGSGGTVELGVDLNYHRFLAFVIRASEMETRIEETHSPMT